MTSKMIRFLLTFWILNVVISLVWYAIEWMTMEQIQTNTMDTFMCLILSLSLSIIICDEHIQKFLNANNKKNK